MSSFRFKQFELEHDRCSHKVGTDGVLLGCWVNIQETDRHLLDIGTGSGLIALILAQRTHPAARIDAVEIHQEDATQARENVLRSPWPEKIALHHAPVQGFAPDTRYDLIVTNPPYFQDSLLPPDRRRSTARHTSELSFPDLIQAVVRLLSPRGRFAVILPPPEALQLTSLCEARGLFPSRVAEFYTRQHKSPERVLTEFSSKKDSPETGNITLYDTGERWSQQYRTLTKDFYIRDE